MVGETCHCRYCKRIFQSYIRKTVCDKCQAIDDERFQVIRDYLGKYPHSNAMQIAEGLNIDVTEILRYIDEGRLNMVKVELKPLDEADAVDSDGHVFRKTGY